MIGVDDYANTVAAPQPGGGTFDTGDFRMLNAVQRGDRLIATHAVGLDFDNLAGADETSARWYEFDVGGGAPTLTQQGNVDPAFGVHTYFPSIEIAPNGDLGMTFMQSSATEFVSMYVTGQKFGDAPGTMYTPVLVQAGTQAYGGARGGDYSGMAVDPVTGNFWAANEVVILNIPGVNWSTRIAEFSIPERTGNMANTSVYFDTGSSDLNDFAGNKAILDDFAARLIADPTLVVTIEGYTDTEGAAGPPGGNQTLSEDRAQAVFNYLTGTHFIAAARLVTVGFGERQLKAPTADGVELEANRRATLTLDRLVYTGSVNLFDDPTSAGRYVVPAQPDRVVSMGLSTDVDRSGEANHGRIYVAFTDQGDLDGDDTTNHDDTDIFVIASDDDGATWTALDTSPNAILASGASLVRVNDDGGNNSQFYAWLDVDQSTGNVGISWYDARNDDGLPGPGDNDGTPNNDVQYFGSISFDSGETWMANQQVSDGASSAFDGRSFDYGDYTALAFVDGTLHMAWADNSNSTGDNPGGVTDTYYGRIDLADVSGPPRRLTADADLLVNAASFDPITITVARDTSNTSLEDLAQDVQRAIDQELFDQGLSIGFDPTDAAFPGTFTTGVRNPGDPAYVAGAAPFAAPALGGALPTDLTVAAVLPATFSVTPVSNGDGAPEGTEETQLVSIEAGVGTFRLSLEDNPSINEGAKQTTAALPYNASAAQIKAALEALIDVNSVTVTRTVSDADDDGVSEFNSTVVFTDPTANLALMTIDGSKLAARVFSGRLRAANVAAGSIAAELDKVLDTLLANTSVSVTVTEAGGGELEVSVAGGPVEIRCRVHSTPRLRAQASRPSTSS